MTNDYRLKELPAAIDLLCSVRVPLRISVSPKRFSFGFEKIDWEGWRCSDIRLRLSALLRSRSCKRLSRQISRSDPKFLSEYSVCESARCVREPIVLLFLSISRKWRRIVKRKKKKRTVIIHTRRAVVIVRGVQKLG